MVIRERGAAELSGMLLRRDGQPAIGLNPERPETSQRFALAHLVGHFHLHRGRELILDTVARYSYGNLASMPTDREEAEANRFAGVLLAPESAVRRLAAEAQFDTAAQLVGILAGRFELSPAVMGYRLMSLGVIVDA
jgi:Zn-dependent peptidase ImmA (M78 family)